MSPQPSKSTKAKKLTKPKESKSSKPVTSKKAISPKNIKPKLFDYLGKEVAQTTNVIPRFGKYAKEVEKKFIAIFKSRELPKITIRNAELGTGMLSDKKPYIVIEQAIGKGAKASSAVNISKYGTLDLQIEHRHFEQGLLVTAAKVVERGIWLYLGIAVLGAGIILSFVGIGLLVIPVGIVMIIIGLRPDTSKTNLVGGQKNESLLLKQAVETSLQEAVQTIKPTKL